MLVLLSAQGACPAHVCAHTHTSAHTHTRARAHTQFLLPTHPEEKYSEKERPVGLLILCARGVRDGGAVPGELPLKPLFKPLTG